MGLFQDIKVQCMCLHKPRRCAMHSQWFFLPFITVQYIEKTLHKLAHHRNYLTIICYDKSYRKSLQWFFWKEADHISKPSRKSLIHWLRRQEETEDLSNKKNHKKQTSSFQVQVTMNDKLNRMELSQSSTWWETSITDSIKITENGEVFTGNPHTNRYLQQPCNYPWFHAEKEHPERRGAPYLMLQ